MKNKTYITNNRIVFSKWSRKNYAIFASLNKVVKIARVSIVICLSSLIKNKSVLRFLKQENQLIISELNKKNKSDLNSNWLTMLLLELGLINLDESCSSSLNTYMNNESPYIA